MKIHLYALCWNEIKMLPYFFRHYDLFVDQYTILDNGSDDGSVEYLKRRPNVRLGHFEVKSDSFILEARRIYDEFWKDSRGKADWVIVCNIDEHLYHENMSEYLRDCASRGITAITSLGCNIISREFPGDDVRLCDTMRRGVWFPKQDKLSIFDPNKIREINYATGRHMAYPDGEVVYPKEITSVLLHYKYLGLDHVMARHAELGARLKKEDITKKLGYHYFWDKEMLTKTFNEIWDRSVEIQNPVQPWKPRPDWIMFLGRIKGRTRRLLEPPVRVSFDA